MPYLLTRQRRIRRSGEYRRVYDGGKKLVGRHLVLFYTDAGMSGVSVGITVSGKVGGACERNRARRRIREALGRLLREDMKKEMVFVAKQSIKKAAFDEILKDAGALLDRAAR